MGLFGLGGNEIAKSSWISEDWMSRRNKRKVTASVMKFQAKKHQETVYLLQGTMGKTRGLSERIVILKSLSLNPEL